MTDDTTPTHIALVKKFYSKKRFTWLEVGKGRLDKDGNFHGMHDRLPVGGWTGYTCFVRIGQQPPEPEPERPDDTGEDEEG
jgi:hypothetical protein